MNIPINFTTICRLCLLDIGTMSIFKMNLTKKISTCASLQISPNDGLPGQICQKCAARLHAAYQFRNQCEKSDVKLRQYLNDGGNKPYTSRSDSGVQIQNIQLCRVERDGKLFNPSGVVDSHSYFPGRLNASSNQNPSLPKQVECDSIQPSLPCDVCNKNFTSPLRLKRHKTAHSKPGVQFKCSFCSKSFGHKSTFKRHMLVHSGEKPFKCSVCGKTCRQLQDVENHMRTHTGERPFTCKICSRAFSTRSTLIAHIRTHTGEKPYVCTVCEKAFCQSNELIKHVRTHTGEKPHSCRICQRNFNGASSLNVHMRVHTDERPYVCGKCDKSFKQSCGLMSHLKTQH